MVMKSKPPLSDDQVREILRMYADDWTVKSIGIKFERTPAAIYTIVNGQSYRHITAPHMHDPKSCRCLGCMQQRHREENLARGLAAEAVGVCRRCGAETPVKVTALLSRPGNVLCARHDGRR